MRREYGLLAELARRPRDAAHAAVIEEQLAVTLTVLHHHHSEEDAWLWPTLRERAPEVGSALDELEAQHVQVDPLIVAALDTSLPLRTRAPILLQLHELINSHLDDEERVVLPLIALYITAQEWDDFGQRALAAIPRQHMPIVLGWAASEASSQEWAALRRMLPRPVRVLAQLIWLPAYARRCRRLYPQPAMGRSSPPAKEHR